MQKLVEVNNQERLYRVSDTELLETGSVIASGSEEDIADFVAFDSTLSSESTLLLKDAVNALLAGETDSSVLKVQAELTQDVLNAMANCNTARKTIMFFARKAFANNKAVLSQFGQDDVRKARRNQVKTVAIMHRFAKTATQYKAQLVAEGCNEILIDQLPEFSETLQLTNDNQENYKDERGIKTQDRIEKLNMVYLKLKQLSDISKIIYSDDPARMKKYTLPKPKSSSDTEDDLIVS